LKIRKKMILNKKQNKIYFPNKDNNNNNQNNNHNENNYYHNKYFFSLFQFNYNFFK